MTVNSINVPHPADPDGTHDTRYLKLDDYEPPDPVTVTDTTTVNLTLTGQDVSADVLPGGIDHQDLDGAGTYDHAYIDATVVSALTHISASSAHGASGNIVGATTLAADIATHAALTATHGATGAVVGTTGAQTLASKTLTTPTISSTGFTNAQHAHAAANSGGVIPHANLSGIGTNSHTTIDSHLAATTGHGATGAVVGTTNTQTLTNKTLTTPTINLGEWANAQHLHVSAATGGQLSHNTLFGIGTNTHPQIDTHIADQLVHTASLPFVSGQYYSNIESGLGAAGALTTAALTANRIQMCPIYVPQTTTFDRIGVNVTAFVALSKIRLGIFTINLATNIATRILDAGEADSSSNGFKELTISQALTPGWYFLATFSGHNPTITVASPSKGLYTSTSLQVISAITKTGGAYAAYSATETMNATSTAIFAVALRAA